MPHKDELVNLLYEKARILRRHAIEMMRQAGQGWLGGSFSEAEIITALYFHHMRHNPNNPDWPERDRLVLSKAHCCEMLYAALGEAGYFTKDQFLSYGRFKGLLQAHSQRTTPGVDYSGGSLGTGLSFAVGSALAARISSSKSSSGLKPFRYRVYCIVGDGECDEGQIWEAAMAAAHYRLDNLTVILDRNRYQSTGPVSETMEIEPLAEKWSSFGWNVIEIDGHDIRQILEALEDANRAYCKPTIIIANTIKGKGAPSLEGSVHFISITEKIYSEVVEALEKQKAE
ncbi:MAG: transketolase [Candidatus Bathyarchaeia archaeon]